MEAFYKARDGEIFTYYDECCRYEADLIIKEKFKMYDIYGNITKDYICAGKIDVLEDLSMEESRVLINGYDYLEDIDEKGFYIWDGDYERWLKNGEIPKRKFEVECNITRYVTVIAEDEDEAEEIVLKMDFDDVFADKEFEIYDIEEVE